MRSDGELDDWLLNLKTLARGEVAPKCKFLSYMQESMA